MTFPDFFIFENSSYLEVFLSSLFQDSSPKPHEQAFREAAYAFVVSDPVTGMADFWF